MLKVSGEFDHCNLKIVKVYINSEVYPYEKFHPNFADNTTSMLYKLYVDFQTPYYRKIGGEPLLSKSGFQKLAPINVVDLSRQDDDIEVPVVNLKILFEMVKQIPTKIT